MNEQSVALDPRGGVPDPHKNVRIILKSASGQEIGNMGFGAPLVEPISSLVVQTQMMAAPRGQMKAVVVNFDDEATFIIVSWDPKQRVIVAKLKA